MKQFITILFFGICLLFVQHETFAQPKHGFTFRALWYNYDNPEPAWKDWTDVFQSNGRGIELAYNRRLDSHTWLVVPAKIGTARRATGPNRTLSKNELLANLDVQGQYNFFKYNAVVNPYLHLGLGSSWNIDDDFFDFNIPAGFGLNIKFLDNVYFNLQSQYRFSLENRPGWHHGIGGTVYFGGEEPPPPPADRDGDGVLDVTDKCPDVPGVAALMGCPDRDGDQIPDVADQCPDQPGPPSLNGCPPPDNEEPVVLESERIRINNQILFEFGSDRIDPKSLPLLDDVAKVLKANPEVGPVLIEGHTDNIGSRAINLDLSKRRARSVELYLTSKGVNRERLRSEGYGFDRPVAPNDTPLNRARNRRTEFKLLDEAKPAR